jgi:rhodanese-related sulfurtransferase
MNTNRHIKDHLFGYVATLTKAIASPKRLELLELLAQAPKTVEQLAAETEMSIALTSSHLQALKTANCVTVTNEGKHRRYQLANAQIAQLWVILHQLATDQIPELAQALNQQSPHQEQQITSIDTLLTLAENKQIQLIDVRPLVEYQYEHLPNAQSIPINELSDKAVQLSKEVPIVAYCRGPFCLYAKDAVSWLRAQGFQASQWRDGVVEFYAATDKISSSNVINACNSGKILSS